MPPVTRRKFIGTIGLLAAPAVTTAAPPEPEVNLLAMGDWGAPRKTKDDPKDAKRLLESQNRVAAAMANYAAKAASEGRPVDAVLPMGDNFYAEFQDDGLQGPDDDRFTTRFEKLYPKATLNVPFYFALGNHDYEDGDGSGWKHQITYAQRDPMGRWQFPTEENTATWYRKDFLLADSKVSMVVLDTNTDHVKKRWKNQIEWLDHQIAEIKDSRWKILVAHHPMFTDGYHWDGKKDPHLYAEIRQSILPKLKGFVFYVSGHDHNQQHIHEHPDHAHLDFLVSGAGGGAFPQKRRAFDRPYKNEFMPTLGFLHLQFTQTQAAAHFISVASDGSWKVGHQVVRT